MRQWQVSLILTLFFVAVAGAAAIGWWYARESPAHQGPIVVIAVDGLTPPALPPYGAPRTDMPAIDQLASDSVVFERAYAHSPQLVPAQSSLLTGQLPFEHGVRDEAGFALPADADTLAEALRNRGFTTGAAVSSFLLRRESGLAQGFVFYDADMPDAAAGVPGVEREGATTLDAAERWARAQRGQRYFLFVHVNEADAEVAVARVTQLLKDKSLYPKATVVLVGERGRAELPASLDEAALHVPLMFKLPGAEGAGRRVVDPVQHIDLLPTILDFVRAPLPDDVRGRSLREVLDGGERPRLEAPIYAELVAPYFRFGGAPLFTATDGRYRYTSGTDEPVLIVAGDSDEPARADAQVTSRLREMLDRVAEDAIAWHAPINVTEEDRLALFGILEGVRPPASATVDADAQPALAQAHHAATVLVGEHKLSSAIRAMQTILRDHPALAVVQYQLGRLLARSGRRDEAIAVYRKAGDLNPTAVQIPLALAELLLAGGQAAAAQEQAAAALMLAADGDDRDRASAHQVAALAALAARDVDRATTHAAAAEDADPSLPMKAFVRGRIAFDEAKFDEALIHFQEAATVARTNRVAVRELHWYLGETLIHLERHQDAELAFREELRAFPRSMQTYTSLAALLRASNRGDEVDQLVDDVMRAAPTPEGYAVAARLWTMLGERTRAEALRSDARARFQGDPALALLGRDVRR